MDDIFSKIPEVVGILPDNKLYRNYPIVYKWVSTLHAICNFAITMYPVGWTVIQMQSENYPKRQVPSDIMTLVKTVFYALIVSVSLLYHNVFYPQDYLDMKMAFKEIDAILQKHGISTKRRCISLQFIVFDIAFVVYMFYSFHVFGRDVHMFYIVLINWIHFNFVLEIILAWRWLELVRHRLVIFNKLLYALQLNRGNADNSSAKSTEFIVSILPEVECSKRSTVFDLINIQRRLAKIVNLFNTLMGLSVAIRSLLFVIGTLNVVLRISTGLWDGFVLAITDSAIDALGWCVFVFKSQHVIDEGGQSADLCLDATTAWLEQNRTESDKEFLSHLTQRVTSQLPQFSAARFYNVNFAAFFMILNMTTGYIVIVVQFSQS